MTKRKVYSQENLFGVEAKSMPLSVTRGHSSYMKNLVGADGALKKRNGWQECFHYRDENDKDLRINGIFEYGGMMAVHAGPYLYYDGVRMGRLEDTKSCGFEKNGLLYIVCAKELFIFDGVEIKNAYGSKYAYIPLTAYDVSPIGYESTEKINEDYSLLTSKRRNRLIGIRSENPYQRFSLDGSIDTSQGISVKTRMITRLDSANESEAPYNAIYKNATRLSSNEIAGVMGADSQVIYNILHGNGTNYDISVSEEVAIFLKKPMKLDSVILFARGDSLVPRFSFHYGSETVYESEGVANDWMLDLSDTLRGKTVDAVYFYGNNGEGVLNNVAIIGRMSYSGEIEITHNAPTLKYGENLTAEKITDVNGKELILSRNETGSSLQGTVIWLEKGVDEKTVLTFNFLCPAPIKYESNIEVTFSVKNQEKISCDIGQICTADDGSAFMALAEGNTLYVSLGMDYFPAHFKKVIGNDAKISAICEMSENVFCVFKEKGAYYFEMKGRELASKGFSSQGGSLSHFATKTVNLDTLSPQKDNVYGSVGTGGRVRRGNNIAPWLEAHDMTKSVALEYNGYYCLFAEGNVYIADTRYRKYHDNRLDSSYEYEWYVLDGIEACYAAVVNGEIFIGREDGRITCINDGFWDIYYEKIDTGSYLFGENEAGQTVLYLNEALNICTGDTLIVSNGYVHLCDIVGMRVVNGKTRLNLNYNDIWTELGYLRLYPQEKIFLKTSLDAYVEATICEVNATELYITVDLKENSDTFVGILKKISNEAFSLSSQEDYFLLLDKYGACVTLCSLEEAKLSCERKTPVKIEYEYPVIFGGVTEKSTVYGLNVCVSGGSEGTVELAYKTDGGQYRGENALGDEFGFDSLDFNSFTFNCGLQKSFSVRCFERNVDYLILRLKHYLAKDFELRGFQVIYNLEGDLK